MVSLENDDDENIHIVQSKKFNFKNFKKKKLKLKKNIQNLDEIKSLFFIEQKIYIYI